MNRVRMKQRRDNFRKNTILFIMIFVLSVFIGSFLYIDRTLRPTITVLAETKALELANRSINKSVAQMVEGKINYEDLMNVQLNVNGTISYIQANTIMMNEIASEIALEIQDELKKVKSTSSYIPIGTALGSPILAKYGPKLKIAIEPIGTVSVDFNTQFESSGINQTRHTIYLEAKTKVKVVIPLITSTKEVSTKIPICETIIVGDVPKSYLNIPTELIPGTLKDVDINQ